jgi:hypothetical protein
MNLMPDGFLDQRVQADTGRASGDGGLGVQVGRQAHDKFATGLLARFDAVLGTGLKKEIERGTKLAA